MAEPTPAIDHLQIVVAHHADNEFYTLARVMPRGGGAVLDWNGAVVHDVTHEVPPSVLFQALPDTPCSPDGGPATCERWCIILDACNANGDVLTDREITQEIADQVLDGQFESRLATARGNLAEFYAHDREVRCG